MISTGKIRPVRLSAVANYPSNHPTAPRTVYTASRCEALCTGALRTWANLCVLVAARHALWFPDNKKATFRAESGFRRNEKILAASGALAAQLYEADQH
jgi:hypothetical protein